MQTKNSKISAVVKNLHLIIQGLKNPKISPSQELNQSLVFMEYLTTLTGQLHEWKQ